METFDTIITPVRRNVARKSTANRPLLNTIIKAPPKIVNKNHLLDESIVSKSNQNSFKSYPSYEPNDFNLYFDDDSKNTSKRSLIDTNKKKYLEYLESSGNSLFHEESEDEDLDLSGVFCVSDDMTKYLDEGNLSPPTNYDSSDESIDLSRVRNYPVKLEKCRNDQCFVSNKVNSPIKEPAIDAGKNIKQELFSEVNNEDNLQPVIVNHDSVISNDSSITELGTQTKKCLFDPNLESVTCKVKVREEVLVCENVPLKMTILEANFDVDHLENVVEDDNFKVDLVNEKDDNVTIIPQVICAMSLGSNEKSELCDATTNSQIPDEQKRNLRKTKKVLLKKEPSKTSDTKITKTSNVHEKRLTRSQMHVNNNTNNNNKRITRNSTRLNPDSLVAKESLNTEINGLRNSYENERFKNDLIDESQNLTNSSSNEETKIPSLSNENSDIPPDQNKEDKTDCRKKANLDKKGKKEINEGVLLHVEATKETELMRDGKIIKDKEEYLKDIESKIDKNLPVVVEKEFDIQQSLTEEILLDQALRLAHQRTSPRLSKIMKEAILKASVQKPCSKPKQSKTSESNSDKTFSQSSESLNGDVDVDEYCETVENQKKKKKENYVISPVAKQTNAENTVEPLTIKICRKNNKKKTGFRLTSKKKRSPKKKEGVISKPVCSKDVNMDDLSKTFEDVLQDDNWCTDDKMNTADSENFKEENAELAGDKNSTNDQKEVLSINTSEQPTSNNSCISDSEVISEVSNVKKSACVNVENINTIDEKVNINADTERNIGNDEMSDLNNSKQHSIGDDSAVNDSSTPLSGGINNSISNSNSKDSVSISSHSKIVTDITSEKNNQIHNQINNDACTHQEPAMDILKCPLITPNTEIQPKVLPLSIASRDPRLRKSHVRVIVEVSTSSVSSSPDLHDIPERTSYTRSIRKRSPPKIDKRDPRTVRRKENFLPNNDRVPETYREYHEINIYSKLTHQDSVRSEIVGSPSEFNRNDNFSPDYRAMGQYRPDSHHPEHYNSFRGDVDLRRRENYSQNSSTEYVNEVRHTKDFTERVYQNHSEHHRVGYQYKETEEEYRCSENYPPGFIPPDNYSRGYKRPSEFNSDHSHHGSPDFREKEHVRERIIERNHISHNEPSYSRWDYAHKKVEDEMKNMWQEERDLIDGPVKSFSRPYYRRKKFSRGEELFERRTTPWDIDNRRFTENERLWVRKTDQELIHGPDRDMRWDRRGRKGFRDVREERSRSPRRDHDRYNGKRSRSPGSFLRSRREASPSPHNSPLVLDSPMSPEPADRYCVLEPTKCLTVPQ
nr:protein PF14_0175 [Halyomorpha halys]